MSELIVMKKARGLRQILQIKIRETVCVFFFNLLSYKYWAALFVRQKRFAIYFYQVVSYVTSRGNVFQI